jgi:hypothetical protein
MRRANGEGSLIKLKGCRFWYAQYYGRNGRKIRISTQTEVKQKASLYCVNRWVTAMKGWRRSPTFAN